jgi:hypothetical protein
MNRLTLIFILLFSFILIGGLAYSLQNKRVDQSPALTTQKDSKPTAQNPAANSTTEASLKITK